MWLFFLRCRSIWALRHTRHLGADSFPRGIYLHWITPLSRSRSELISILPDKMFNKLLFLGNKCNSSEKRKPKLLWTSKCRNVQNERLWVVPADKHITLCRTHQRHAAVKHAESKHPNTITSIVHHDIQSALQTGNPWAEAAHTRPEVRDWRQSELCCCFTAANLLSGWDKRELPVLLQQCAHSEIRPSWYNMLWGLGSQTLHYVLKQDWYAVESSFPPKHYWHSNLWTPV